MLINLASTLTEKRLLAPNTWLFRFTNETPFEFVAGQYLILFVPHESGEPLRRLYSIASPPSQKGSFELIVGMVPGGAASEYLSHLNVGEKAQFQGPAGRFILQNIPQQVVFLATGTGIAPIRSILYESLPTIPPTTHISLFWGLRTLQDVYLFDELRKFTADFPNFSLNICLSRQNSLSPIPPESRSFFHQGRANEVYFSTLHNKLITGNLLEATNYYLCGGREVVESLRNYLFSLNIHTQYIFFEKF